MGWPLQYSRLGLLGLPLAVGCLDGSAPGSDAVPCETGSAQVAVGEFHACALSCEGAVKCWGGNGRGELGVGDTDNRGDGPDEMGQALPEVELGEGARAVRLAAGRNHTCALLEHGALKCWGSNARGQLGLGDIGNRGDEAGELGEALPEVELGDGRHAVAIAAGGAHTCALLDDGALVCWGANDQGQLGVGDTDDRGDDPGEMGDGLQAVRLPEGVEVSAVAAGHRHSCALDADGRVHCWGANGTGQLGLGDTDARGGDPSAAPGVVELGGAAVALSDAGGSHTCALLDDGALKCWGDNRLGGLGVGDVRSRGRHPLDMGDNLAAVDLGAARVVQASAGSAHTCAALADGSATCWGYNGYANLGAGDLRNRGGDDASLGDALVPVALGDGAAVRAVHAGSGNHSCALLQDGAVKCWGSAAQGQLGQGHGETQGDDPDELGDALPEVALW